MKSAGKTLFVLGGSGFIGLQVLHEAVSNGWIVRALARSEAAAAAISTTGAEVVRGEAGDPVRWIAAAHGAEVLIDLVQPARSARLGRKQMRRISDERQAFTRELVVALLTLEPAERPCVLSVSGIDDLALDESGVRSAHSTLCAEERGFNTIGIPVRRIIERSGIDSAFAYLGTVYGPGGPFAKIIVPAVAAGKWKNFGTRSDRMLLIHVEDAARGLVAIADQSRERVAGRSFVLVDDAPVSMEVFFSTAAGLIGVRAPGRVPTWMAELAAGKPIVETTLQKEPVRSTFADLSCALVRTSFREGLPDTLCALGYNRSA